MGVAENAAANGISINKAVSGGRAHGFGPFTRSRTNQLTKRRRGPNTETRRRGVAQGEFLPAEYRAKPAERREVCTDYRKLNLVEKSCQ